MMETDKIVYFIVMVCWFASMIFCYKVTEILIEIKKGWFFHGVVAIGCLFVIHMVMYIGDLANLPPTMLAFFLVIWFCCEGSRWKRISVSVLICVAAFSYSTLVDSYLPAGSYWSSLLRLPFWFLVWMIMAKSPQIKNDQLSDTMWKLIFILTLTPLGIVLSIMLLQSPYYLTLRGAILSNIVLLIIAIASLVGILRMIPVLAGKEKLEEQNHLYEINRAYYESLEEQQIEIRILRHDMANHLQVLTSLEGEERDDYLRQLVRMPAIGKSVSFCENKVVNSVIHSKLRMIEEENIKFSADLFIPSELPFDAVDLCAVFANGLDNAIEDCDKVREQNRFIKMTAKTEKGLLALKITNAFAGNLETKHGLPTTTKKSKDHGFGLRSIREIVERYGGDMELTSETEQFSLFLYLPLNQDKE